MKQVGIEQGGECREVAAVAVTSDRYPLTIDPRILLRQPCDGGSVVFSFVNTQVQVDHFLEISPVTATPAVVDVDDHIAQLRQILAPAIGLERIVNPL